MSARVLLNPGREKSLLRRHPWIFSKAIKKLIGKPIAGETVDVFDSQGKWLAKGAFSPDSQIRIRVWSFIQKEEINDQFFFDKIQSALHLRQHTIESANLTGYRLVAGESDGLPGVTIDVYDNILSCQLLSAGAEFNRHLIIQALTRLFPGHAIYDRSDVEIRKKEGLELSKGWIKAPENGSTVAVIQEHDVNIKVDVETGHKTGFYLDQRDSRRAAGRYAYGKNILNCFSYTGTFSLHCAKHGAKKVTNVDVSDTAISLSKENLRLNGIEEDVVEHVQADVFKLLRKYREQGTRFDMIILDPPKFAESKSQLNGACRGYKDINMLAMQLLNPNGILLTFSCSGLMEANLFQKVVADAALDAKRQARIIERLHQASDHPIATNFPEGYYLKGLICQMD
ncbi:class I SAM-dependent rRNA methyltransferase [Thalassotalea mangrovi]|uniref:Methyltransferase domain-containing protein n=1 Tax=Thalassotalea mangrovi TaxID=2572245 RepID=A0A4U1B490_9GAMM|nr:class I SAM-dependent methyltransferase [Thalassotalea mangrovi]TKB44759.1 methyltransferase domain-containing protein [Thalassotalea mangrovi]